MKVLNPYRIAEAQNAVSEFLASSATPLEVEEVDLRALHAALADERVWRHVKLLLGLQPAISGRPQVVVTARA